MHARLRYACAVRTREQPRSGWEKVARRRREAPQRLDPAANEGSPERAAQRVTLAATFLPVSQEGFLMPSTHLSLHYHLVFSTKNRLPMIVNEWRANLHAYMEALSEAGSRVIWV